MSQNFPSVEVQGVYNFRDISSGSNNHAIRSGFIFRSAQPYNATCTGVERLKAFGITTIFDLRSDKEVAETAKVTPLRAINGLKRHSVPVFEETEDKLASKLAAYFSSGPQAVTAVYGRMLAEGSKCFRAIFCHLRDKPSEPCIIHCALGKDRTGIAVALILRLAGMSKQEITEEYALTNVGLEAYKPALRNMLAVVSKLDWDESKVAAMLTVRAETMLAVLETLDTQYGGVESYLKNQCSFDDLDIELIKFNLQNESEKHLIPPCDDKVRENALQVKVLELATCGA